jgi:tryptophan synthase alpha subunit
MTPSRISTTFDKLKQHQRKALIPFFTAGAVAARVG